jgi:hypothetical protein
VFLVDVVYWGVLYPDMDKGKGHDFMSVNQHGVNFIFIIIEYSLNRLPWLPWNAAPLLAWPILYGVFAWIYHEITDVYG